MDEKPNYYAVIPADVRYASIPANAKLLYGEITALCSKEGFCWASDSYFAGLYEVSRETANRLVQILKKHNFIRVETTRDQKGTLRKLYLTTSHRSDENVTPVLQKSHKGVLQKDHTSITSTSITISNLPTTEAEKIYEQFIKRFGFAPVKSKQANLNSIARIMEKNKVGSAELVKFMQYAASIQGEKYAPSINSFWDIEDKWPDIARYKAKSDRQSERIVKL